MTPAPPPASLPPAGPGGVLRSWRRLAAALLLLAAFPARAAREIVYVALGGSTELSGSARPGDAARVARRLAPLAVRVHDLSAPEATVRAVRDEQVRRAAALNPTVVSLAVGPLEASGPSSLRSFSRDLEIVADLLRRTKAVVVISTIAPAERLRGGAGRAFRQRVDAFNWVIVRVARRHGFLLADVRQAPAGEGRSWEAAVGGAVERVLAPARPPGVERAATIGARAPAPEGGGAGLLVCSLQ